jgi:hypothetical protein
VIAFKWLARGAVAPFTGFHWPLDGSWVTAAENSAEGSGVHACRVSQLAFWVGEELWRVELTGPVVERETEIEAQRGRLLGQVNAWDPAAFVEACAARAAEVAAASARAEMIEFAAFSRSLPAPTAAFVAASIASRVRGTPTAFAEERAWQARWLAEALDLRDG